VIKCAKNVAVVIVVNAVAVVTAVVETNEFKTKVVYELIDVYYHNDDIRVSLYEHTSQQHLMSHHEDTYIFTALEFPSKQSTGACRQTCRRGPTWL
jgi:hypothetical protein